MTDSLPNAAVVHVCIATGQNAANLIPLEQLDAREIWILQTPAMRAGAAHLATVLKGGDRVIRRIDFDDSTPRTIEASAQAVAEQLDGRRVVLHVTGGTKLMVLALRDELRLVETGAGQLDILYADTAHQRLDWLGREPRSEPMADVLDLRQMLMVQGYRIEGDSRLSDARRRAEARADLSREMGENARRYGKFFSALATLASKALESADVQAAQHFQFAPGGAHAALLQQIHDKGLVNWQGEETVHFTDTDTARYLAGGWLEEYVLLKLAGLVKRTERLGSNLHVVSADGKVLNEIDAMVVARNRALLIECKTGRQTKAQDALYKLSQLRQSLGGSVAGAIYLSAQPVDELVRQRAREYRIEVLACEEVATLVPKLREWLAA